jgi:predicted O-methyltransferase YrrM
MDHSAITAVVTAGGSRKYGVGIDSNPYCDQEKEYVRRHQTAAVREMLTNKIHNVLEPRFITPPPTSEFIEALATMTDSRQILELGSLTGFTTMHLIRSVVGKAGAKVVSVDGNPEYDREFFSRPEISPWVEFIHGWTPEVLKPLNGRRFDLVFIDTDHSVQHTMKELDALLPITTKGTIFVFHDVPEWQTPDNKTPPPVRTWLLDQVDNKTLYGFVLPSCEQQDCLATFGEGYPKECNPGLGVFVRR